MAVEQPDAVTCATRELAQHEQHAPMATPEARIFRVFIRFTSIELQSGYSASLQASTNTPWDVRSSSSSVSMDMTRPAEE